LAAKKLFSRFLKM